MHDYNSIIGVIGLRNYKVSFSKKATLRYPQAAFDDTIYDPDRMLDTETIERLATCRWIDEGRNLLITGATGAGKSYISNALCIAAIRQFKTIQSLYKINYFFPSFFRKANHFRFPYMLEQTSRIPIHQNIV